MNSQQELLDAINTISQKQDRSCDTPATVLRVEDDTVWVHIDGGADETPVRKTISCEQGETVQVRISNGSAFLVGNASAPPTDDKVANVAHFVAEQAEQNVENLERTVEEEYVASGDSNIHNLSSTMYQNEYGVNIYNNTLAVGDSYAHIDGDSFDIKVATTAGEIDDVNDTTRASFGQEVTIGWRAVGSTVGDFSQVFGAGCEASGNYSHAEGYETIASGNFSHAEGQSSTASGNYSHAEGKGTTASGNYSHAEGEDSTASGYYSHAEGYDTDATWQYSHAEGYKTKTGNDAAHAEGGETFASAKYSHAEGFKTYASNDYSHAEGRETIASGLYSHAEGYVTEAEGQNSHAQNLGTRARATNQTAIGKYNIVDGLGTYAFILGNGTANDARSDALRIKWDGSVIDGNGNKISPTILISTTISASATSYTFTDNRITADSTVEVFDEIDGFEYISCVASSGSCVITFDAQSTSHKIKLFVW